MNIKYLILIVLAILVIFAGSVSAADNGTEDVMESSGDDKLKSGYYYSADDDEIYPDKTIDAKDLSIYYGSSKTYDVKVLKDDGTPESNVNVHLDILGSNLYKIKVKTSNSKGIASFSMKYGVGKYLVTSTVNGYDDNGTKTDDYWFTFNTIKIKSTIPTKTLSKSIKDKNKKFSIKFLDSNGKALKNKKIKIKVKGKTHIIKTTSRGIAKIKINSLSVGKHKLTAINTQTKEKKKISVVIKK